MKDEKKKMKKKKNSNELNDNLNNNTDSINNILDSLHNNTFESDESSDITWDSINNISSIHSVNNSTFIDNLAGLDKNINIESLTPIKNNKLHINNFNSILNNENTININNENNNKKYILHEIYNINTIHSINTRYNTTNSTENESKKQIKNKISSINKSPSTSLYSEHKPGECYLMYPESESTLRLNAGQLRNKFEIDISSCQPTKYSLIKEYSKSNSGHKINLKDLRCGSVLRLTIQYLMNIIICNNIKSSANIICQHHTPTSYAIILNENKPIKASDYKIITHALNELKLNKEYLKIFQNQNVTDLDLKSTSHAIVNENTTITSDNDDTIGSLTAPVVGGHGERYDFH